MNLNHPILLFDEEDDQFQEFRGGYLRSIRPTSDLELDLTRHLAGISWRIHRLRAMEAGLLNTELDPCEAPFEDGLSLQKAGMRAGAAFRRINNESAVFDEIRKSEAHLHQLFNQTLQMILDLRQRRPPGDEPGCGPFLLKRVA